MMIWIAKHPQANFDMMGSIPTFIDDTNPATACEQFNHKYIGGWRPFPGFTMMSNGNLLYPGDPPTKLLYETKLRDEVIRVYQHAWVVVLQPDGSYEVSRMD